MPDPSNPIADLLKEDSRYDFDAYVFVFEALNYAQETLGMGQRATAAEPPDKPEDEPAAVEKHVTGQELCMAIHRFAVEQFGYMAKDVLNSWGIHETGDFGEIVFNLIRVGRMRKTTQDHREDFNDVYDFQTAFRQEFKIAPPDKS